MAVRSLIPRLTDIIEAIERILPVFAEVAELMRNACKPATGKGAVAFADQNPTARGVAPAQKAPLAQTAPSWFAFRQTCTGAFAKRAEAAKA